MRELAEVFKRGEIMQKKEKRKQKKRKIVDKLKLLNPKNLENEVCTYGYHFSWKSHILLVIAALAGISAVGFLFQLEPLLFFLLLAAVIMVFPVLIVDMYKKMYEQKRFADVAAYMEQLLYSFQKTGKVVSALKETREIFPDGQMSQVIDRALRHLEWGKPFSGEGVLRESLYMIEESYDCTKLHMVHELLANAEEYGGEVETSIVLVLEDIERWKRRGYRLQADKKKSHIDNIVSIIVATILCAVAITVLDSMKGMFAAGSELQVFKIPVIQFSSAFFLIFLLYVFVKSSRNLTDNWLQEQVLSDPEYIKKSYEMVIKYDEQKARKQSICWAVPVLLLTVLSLALGKKALGILGIALAGFFLMQHKVGYYLAKRDVTDELHIVLPQWLMELALLLQNNNVQVALAKSAENVPVILKQELQLLNARILEAPGKLQAYTAFCDHFDLPEVQGCMKMLHAVSETGTGNISVQMNHLLKRVGEMQDVADDLANAKIAFRMKMIFSYPVIGATVKLLVDLTVGMFVMFHFLGGMGGM